METVESLSTRTATAVAVPRSAGHASRRHRTTPAPAPRAAGPTGGPRGPLPRVGHISFLNCMPLLWGLTKTGGRADVDLIRASPDVLNTALAEGRLDISAISVFEFLKHADDLVVLPGIAVGSARDVGSCLIFSKVPLDQLDGARVALGSTSRTSVRLAQLLLAERIGVSPDYHVAPPDLGAMLADAEAAVVIGDPALRAAVQGAARLGLHVYDLAGMWRDWTGLPFVFAVYAARRTFLAREPGTVHRVHQALLEARDLSLQEIGLICEQAAEDVGLDARTLTGYYIDNLDFSFGPRQLGAVAEFARRVGGPGAGFPQDVKIDVLPPR